MVMRTCLTILTIALLTGCSHWNELGRKHRGASIGAGAGAIIGAAIGGPGGAALGAAADAAESPDFVFDQEAVPAIAESHPRTLVSKVGDLKVGEPIDFKYPTEKTNAALFRLGDPVAGGVGPDGDIVGFLTSRMQVRGLSPKTGNHYRGILSRLFTWAMTQYGVKMPNDVNPAAKVERYRERARTIRFLTLPQIDEQLEGGAYVSH